VSSVGLPGLLEEKRKRATKKKTHAISEVFETKMAKLKVPTVNARSGLGSPAAGSKSFETEETSIESGQGLP